MNAYERPSARQLHLDEVVDRGFDMSTITSRGAIRVKCSQCEALVINDIATHEAGCPNQRGTCDDCGKPCHRRQRLCDACYQFETEQEELTERACKADLPWAKGPCCNTATDEDGFCDECRAVINDEAGNGDDIRFEEDH